MDDYRNYYGNQEIELKKQLEILYMNLNKGDGTKEKIEQIISNIKEDLKNSNTKQLKNDLKDLLDYMNSKEIDQYLDGALIKELMEYVVKEEYGGLMLDSFLDRVDLNEDIKDIGRSSLELL